MNITLLKIKMLQNGLTQRDLAKKIGVVESSFSLKMTGKRDFSTKEIKSIMQVLNLTDSEVVDIFFCK